MNVLHRFSRNEGYIFKKAFLAAQMFFNTFLLHTGRSFRTDISERLAIRHDMDIGVADPISTC
jgi:hypothetical protein